MENEKIFRNPLNNATTISNGSDPDEKENQASITLLKGTAACKVAAAEKLRTSVTELHQKNSLK